ncbi:undecaprenyl-diphosphatase [Hypericibacter terrae]|jgi:undecaprenyl-diphosphatase|uniref:Undecaprenyl-diphosphatase n=1 Tax=Hypericibacter terrae TaxID=2602015 RepID=A0A5J6MIV4_9PROT|nr:undecaprenyl-diphosphate phosphatase [Hypericibacter terrae]QEX17299.1 undecaprenyl-diphosphatase [Hypericibacter terrae]
MSWLQALLIAVLQGASELFPVSSLGHAVILPALLGWDLDQNGPSFLPFLVVLHVGTAAALLLYFWRDWTRLASTLMGFGSPEECAAGRRLTGLILLATLPAVIFGFALEKPLRHLFGTPVIAAVFLIVNGLVLFFGDRLRRAAVDRADGNDLGQMSWRDALIVGFCQCGALIPGISRSGATMVGGLLRGLHHEAAAHFSFLIATPIIIGAAILEIPKMLRQPGGGSITEIALLSGLVAGIVAFVSVWFLMRYFRKHDFQALNPFAYYCWAVGILALGVFALER